MARPKGSLLTHLLVTQPRDFRPIRSVRELRTQALNPCTEGVRKVRAPSPAMGGKLRSRVPQDIIQD
ncbi:hypothetical protein NDU88_000739 [Pleurodeles waltl]|uniref:Uncharacterized protein n=1 Tax=Pleurodeles waltl TaxID=8319 RepID=A0AAV7VWX7_PLEWA|nr:hypothetical protein NDU88_000739 [Pleurodeles waltl]